MSTIVLLFLLIIFSNFSYSYSSFSLLVKIEIGLSSRSWRACAVLSILSASDLELFVQLHSYSRSRAQGWLVPRVWQFNAGSQCKHASTPQLSWQWQVSQNNAQFPFDRNEKTGYQSIEWVYILMFTVHFFTRIKKEKNSRTRLISAFEPYYRGGEYSMERFREKQVFFHASYIDTNVVLNKWSMSRRLKGKWRHQPFCFTTSWPVSIHIASVHGSVRI